MSYSIWNKIGTKRLSSAYLNGNWKTSDIFVYRENSWIVFDSKEELIDKIAYFKKSVSESTHYTEWLKEKLLKHIEKMGKNSF